MDSVTANLDNLVISNLLKDSLFYRKIEAFNQIGTSTVSEVLPGVPSLNDPRVFIASGDDRASAQKTHDFIRQHTNSIMSNLVSISLATIGAIIDSLFSLGS